MPGERLIQEAAFLGTWGHLVHAGVPEPQALDALATTGPAALRPLAAAIASAPTKRAAALDEHGDPLSSWVRALLADLPTAEAERGSRLVETSGVLLEEQRAGWTPGRLWRKAGLLRGGRGLGDGLAALAREARDHEHSGLGEALYGAARRARQGADLTSALRECAEAPGLDARFQLVFAALDAERLEEALAALEGLAAIPWSAESAASVPQAGDEPDSLKRFTEAAKEGAAPIRRGLDRLLSGIEGALGIKTGETEELDRVALARQAVESRQTQGGGPRPRPTRKASSAVPRDGRPAPSSARKTIGSESGPVRHAPLDPAERLSLRWNQTFDLARAKLSLLDVQHDLSEGGQEVADLRAEFEAEVAALHEQLTELEQPADQRQLLEELESRYQAWVTAEGL
jgi:hypothetical protein